MRNTKSAFTITTYDADENEVELTLPTRCEVCPRCHGRGAHDPAGFSDGFTPEDFAEAGEDFTRDYFAGRYDVTCSECHGRNVVEVPDESKMTREQLAAWRAHCDEERDYRATVAAERRMGA